MAKAQMTVAEETPRPVASPARRLSPTAVRETTRKAGPGLAAPIRFTSITVPSISQKEFMARLAKRSIAA